MSLDYNAMLMALALAPKRKVFVSYHHRGDQWYYDEFSRRYADSLEVFCDTSLERAYDSEDTDYVRWAIRQNNIIGSSCTIVLCGAATPGRKYVDWEIKATLDKQHGLIGIGLPTAIQGQNNNFIVPERLFDDYQSGHAQWMLWDNLTALTLKAIIENAVNASSWLIKNARTMRQRNS